MSSFVSLVFGLQRNTTVGAVEFQASLSETHTKTNTVTSHPVDAGADITDHIRIEPDQLEITGVVSNTPIVLFRTVTQRPTQAEDAYNELRRIMNEGELVKVVTTLREYENMALQSLTVTRDRASGNVVNAQMSLRQVELAELQEVTAPVPVAAENAPRSEDGRQTTRQAAGGEDGSLAQTSKSLLTELLGLFS